MRDRTRVVIVGAGIAGASIAYHLAQLGWTDVVVLDQGDLIGGTTSHAPGLVGQLRTNPSLARMLMHSVSLYKRISIDGVPGYRREGSIRLASSKARLTQLQQNAALAQKIGIEAHFITLREAQEMFPLMDMAGVEGALFLPDDGSATAAILARGLIDGAQAGGVEFVPHTPVTGIEVAQGRVQAVVTPAGQIQTEIIVAACGIWSPIVGRLAGVSIPLTPMQHQYAITAPLPELVDKCVPNLRDPDKLVYFRQRDDSLVFGGYERTPAPWDVDAIPSRRDPTVQSFNAAQFEPLRRAAAERVPAIGNVQLARTVNGLESFTPDGEFLLGPAPEVHGFWAACGFCAHGVSGAGGVGKVIAEWIVHGDPGLDLSAMALSRFGGKRMEKATIQAEASRVYRTYYDLAEHSTAANRMP
jgi:4-methylaminobutanoate oxidase (formaldehyde-forming)